MNSLKAEYEKLSKEPAKPNTLKQRLLKKVGQNNATKKAKLEEQIVEMGKNLFRSDERAIYHLGLNNKSKADPSRILSELNHLKRYKETQYTKRKAEEYAKAQTPEAVAARKETATALEAAQQKLSRYYGSTSHTPEMKEQKKELEREIAGHLKELRKFDSYSGPVTANSLKQQAVKKGALGLFNKSHRNRRITADLNNTYKTMKPEDAQQAIATKNTVRGIDLNTHKIVHGPKNREHDTTYQLKELNKANARTRRKLKAATNLRLTPEEIKKAAKTTAAFETAKGKLLPALQKELEGIQTKFAGATDMSYKDIKSELKSSLGKLDSKTEEAILDQFKSIQRDKLAKLSTEEVSKEMIKESQGRLYKGETENTYIIGNTSIPTESKTSNGKKINTSSGVEEAIYNELPGQKLSKLKILAASPGLLDKPVPTPVAPAIVAPTPVVAPVAPTPAPAPAVPAPVDQKPLSREEKLAALKEKRLAAITQVPSSKKSLTNEDLLKIHEKTGLNELESLKKEYEIIKSSKTRNLPELEAIQTKIKNLAGKALDPMMKQSAGDDVNKMLVNLGLTKEYDEKQYISDQKQKAEEMQTTKSEAELPTQQSTPTTAPTPAAPTTPAPAPTVAPTVTPSTPIPITPTLEQETQKTEIAAPTITVNPDTKVPSKNSPTTKDLKLIHANSGLDKLPDLQESYKIALEEYKNNPDPNKTKPENMISLEKQIIDLADTTISGSARGAFTRKKNNIEEVLKLVNKEKQSREDNYIIEQTKIAEDTEAQKIPTSSEQTVQSPAVSQIQGKVPSQILTTNALLNESTSEGIYDTIPGEKQIVEAAEPTLPVPVPAVQSPVVEEPVMYDEKGKVVPKSVLKENDPNRSLPSGPTPSPAPSEFMKKLAEAPHPYYMSAQDVFAEMHGGSRHSSLKKYKKSKKTKQSKKFKTNKNHKNKKSKKRLLSRKNKK